MINIKLARWFAWSIKCEEVNKYNKILYNTERKYFRKGAQWYFSYIFEKIESSIKRNLNQWFIINETIDI